MSSAEPSEDLEFNPFYQAIQVNRVTVLYVYACVLCRAQVERLVRIIRWCGV